MDPERFYNYNSATGWMMSGKSIQDWRAAARMWDERDRKKQEEARAADEKEICYGNVL